MLEWLSIQGLALVDRIELSFDPALNVLTGETGAGKSLILGSIGLLLGERADPDWLRSGAERGFVEGIFDLAARPDLEESLRAIGVEIEEHKLVLRRELTGEGKSRGVANGRTVLVQELRSIGDLLIDLHGQHEHQLLLRPESQAEFYDSWAGLLSRRRALERERIEIGREMAALRDLRAGWERDRSEGDRVREDLLELTRAALEEGEEDRLRADRERLRHRERTIETLREARRALEAEEGGAEAPARRAARALRSLAGSVPEIDPLALAAEATLESLRDLAGRIEDQEERALEEPLPLERLEERLDRIHRLKRKHATDFTGLLVLRGTLEARAAALDPDPSALRAREDAIAWRLAAFASDVDVLVEERRTAAPRFTSDVESRLSRLGFQKASLTVSLGEEALPRDRPAIDPAVIPGLEFRFRPNTGEPARSLRRIASGGELSRVMLAVKSMMAEQDQVAVLVFDEVDQGIGGAVGEEVGRMLRVLAARRQVLCITHLPLIAAFATRHFQVVKTEVERRTVTGVRLLDPDDREREIARLLAGARVSETTRRQARELLRAARS